ncbi:hypothetical protein [Acinetobacter bereziniae]|uniref:hypothetical protein n=1 Tax=Acinetobacter bereziniae TaxID=106648 RepID=UPI0018DC68AE|nr:hypothetical protein [Acinetobacter bereziniae]MBI0395441.1 hypothetical protein [Acinetobacter bereziniae]
MSQEKTESYPVKRGKFDSLTIYDVTSQELQIIEQGSNSLVLNFAIFLLSVSTSFFISIFTVEWFPNNDYNKNLISFIVFLIIAILTLLIGVICLFVWKKSQDSFTQTIKVIKCRLKEEVTETIDNESTDVTTT